MAGDIYLSITAACVLESMGKNSLKWKSQLYLLKGKTKFSFPKKLRSDLVRWFGTYQRVGASEEYLNALDQIAALSEKLLGDKPGLEIVIPVKNYFTAIAGNGTTISAELKPLDDIRNAEVVVKNEWKKYEESGEGDDVEFGSLRCTFVMEPMVLDFGDSHITRATVDVMKILVRDNVRFSSASFWMSLTEVLGIDPRASKEAFGELMASIFGSVRRPGELARTRYYSDGISTCSDESSALQLGLIDLNCDFSLRTREFEAMCSALVTSQTTKQIAMYLHMNSRGRGNSEHWWKWLAYAFFSKLAHEHSSLESLTLTSIDNLSSADMEQFATILASKHPEEDLCGCPPGLVEERDAILKASAPIHWDFTGRGQPRRDSPPLTFESTLPLVRTFSDDGESEFVNVMIPGCGRCQVQRSDLEFAQHNIEKISEGGVSSLTLRFDDAEEFGSDGLPNFLAATGSSLKVLTLHRSRIEMDENIILHPTWWSWR